MKEVEKSKTSPIARLGFFVVIVVNPNLKLALM